MLLYIGILDLSRAIYWLLAYFSDGGGGGYVQSGHSVESLKIDPEKNGDRILKIDCTKKGAKTSENPFFLCFLWSEYAERISSLGLWKNRTSAAYRSPSWDGHNGQSREMVRKLCLLRKDTINESVKLLSSVLLILYRVSDAYTREKLYNKSSFRA